MAPHSVSAPPSGQAVVLDVLARRLEACVHDDPARPPVFLTEGAPPTEDDLRAMQALPELLACVHELCYPWDSGAGVARAGPARDRPAPPAAPQPACCQQPQETRACQQPGLRRGSSRPPLAQAKLPPQRCSTCVHKGLAQGWV